MLVLRTRSNRRKKGPDIFTQAKLIGLPKPVCEYAFDPDRDWRADYAWPEYKLVVEIEGGAFNQGRHVRGKGFVKDMEKYNQLAILGYFLLRFTPGQVSNRTAIRFIQTWFEIYKRPRI